MVVDVREVVLTLNAGIVLAVIGGNNVTGVLMVTIGPNKVVAGCLVVVVVPILMNGKVTNGPMVVVTSERASSVTSVVVGLIVAGGFVPPIGPIIVVSLSTGKVVDGRSVVGAAGGVVVGVIKVVMAGRTASFARVVVGLIVTIG